MTVRMKMCLCPMIVILLPAWVALWLVGAGWPVPVQVTEAISPWHAGMYMESIFVGRVTSVSGLVNRTVTVEVLEVLQGAKLPARMDFPAGTVAGTEDVGARILAYIPHVDQPRQDWRDDEDLARAGGLAEARHLRRTVPEGVDNRPRGLVLTDQDIPLAMEDLVFPARNRVSCRLIDLQKQVLLVQRPGIMTASGPSGLMPDQVAVLEEWLDRNREHERPHPLWIRDFLKNLADGGDRQAARLHEEYERLGW